jgi:glycosyltransferase involved in cell wall biosynthesis
MLDIWSLNQSALKKKLYLELVLKRDLERASALIFTAPQERDQVMQLRISTDSIVEPLAIDFEALDIAQAADMLRRLIPALGESRFLLFLGRVHPKKGLEILLAAMTAVRNDTELVVAGPCEHDYLNALKKQIDELGISDRVHFIGMVKGDTKRALLAAASLFVLSSYQENFGVAVAEALVSGTPAIVSKQVNLANLIVERSLGGVVPMESAALAAEINRWLDDDELREQAGERAARVIRETLDSHLIALRWKDHYAQVVERNQAIPEEPATQCPILRG